METERCFDEIVTDLENGGSRNSNLQQAKGYASFLHRANPAQKTMTGIQLNLAEWTRTKINLTTVFGQKGFSSLCSLYL